MEKHFATYEQSLGLKELGYDEPCFRYIYIGDTGNNVNHYEEVKVSESKNYNTDLLCISQPLKSQVFEWFREKYNWHNVPLGTVRLSDNKVVYHIGKPNIIYPYGKVYDTYEEAESACIDNLIEKAKNK